jgi:hypothetical protein
MKVQRIGVFVFSGLLAVCLLAQEALAQRPQHANIVFLRLRMTQGTITLVGLNVRPGKIKLPRAPSRTMPLSYDLVSSAGGVLWTYSMNDPSIRRYEYEDPDEPGRIRMKREMLDTVEFTVRIPYFEGLDRVEFYQTRVPAEGAMSKAGRRLIGTAVLSSAEGRR